MNTERIEHTLSHELDVAVSLAHEAGVAIMDFYNSSFIIEEKLGLDNFTEPVTEADRRASEIIVAGLEENFPHDGILSEEKADTAERLEKRRVWMIDPIDGTRGFINRDGDFAVQIGLTIEGESVLGVVYEPLIERLFWAVKDAGAWLELPAHQPVRLRVSDETRFGNMILAASRSHRSPKMNRIVKEFHFKNEIKRGSVGVKVGLLAMRECDVYIHLSPRTKQWDTCAPQIILEEAGGLMTDLFGGKIVYNTASVQNYNGVVSSNGAVHEEIINRLKPLLTEFGRYRVKTA
ncbi:MAG TPA: 3'(2'),5'-bisphosphate nucleotidase CysQ, partial [Pyrinomonadaceae bacterium]|nr:3'(2'),5'-bisphosphate nucleotidase CysQ [Pyrinomonadaceae bacterium]